MNTVILTGRLTKEPEVKTLQTGSTVLSFTLAVDRHDKDKNTDFIFCKAWGTKADFIAKYFSKGDPLSLEGSIRSGSYVKDGKKVSTYEVLVNSVEFVPKSRDSQKEEQESDGGLIF